MLAKSTVGILLMAMLSTQGQCQKYSEEDFFAFDLAGSKRSEADLDFRQSPMPLLFGRTWTRGSIISANNVEYKNDSFFLNFDKLSQSLFVTSNYQRFYEIDRKEIKAVTFYRGDSALVFEHIYYIDNKHLFQVIVPNGNKYCLFKLIRSVLRKRELSSGMQYFAYVDVPLYYVIFPNKEYRKLRSLKRKSIAKIFGLLPERGKVDNYLIAKGENYSGESYLKDLIAYLNKE
ncbi:MAG: hypothetical protein ACHQET_09720 [Chitinophagales bacterium]